MRKLPYSEAEKGIICWCACLAFYIIASIGMRALGYFDTFSLNGGKFTHLYLPFKLMYYGSFITSLMGYFYIFGDIERDFNKIIIIVIAGIIIMDIRAIPNFIGYVNTFI